MGYGKNLKQALDDKGMTVRDLCRQMDISPTTLLPLLSLCGRDELTKLHETMSDYYVLNDEGRKQMFTMMDMLKNTYTDSERKKALKSIKK